MSKYRINLRKGILVGCIFFLLVGCEPELQGNSDNNPQVVSIVDSTANPEPQPEQAEESDEENGAVFDVSEPPIFPVDRPLSSAAQEVPIIYIVPHEQPKEELAKYLKTTSRQLDWVNPRLPDPVPANTLVAIPPFYLTSFGETFSEVADKTGVSETLLRATNIALEHTDVLTVGEFLTVPPIYITPANMPLQEIATLLEIDIETLLSANPDVVDLDEVKADTVLIVPIK